MLKCLLFFLLGILASLVVFFTPWWLSITLIVLLILFRLVKAEARLREEMPPHPRLHHRSIQKFEP
jgi:NhaP-type Na+/H+ or K+/H+ antiporter